MNMKRAVCALVTITTMALAGCGGGGGGSSPMSSNNINDTPTTPTTPTPPGNTGGGDSMPTTFAGLTSTTAENAQHAAAQVADAIPRFGSVTQSSNTVNNITQDQVTITTSYGAAQNTYSIRNGSTWSISTADGNPELIPTTNTSGFRGSELNKQVNGGTLWVDVYSDIEAPTSGASQPVTVMSGDDVEYTGSSLVLGRGQSTQGELNGQPGTFTCAQTGCSVSFRGGVPNQGRPIPVNTVNGITFVPSGSGTVDTDYLSGGIWLFVPNNPEDAEDYVFGAFADGSDPFTQSALPALIGPARYIGEATGIYSATENDATQIGVLRCQCNPGRQLR